MFPMMFRTGGRLAVIVGGGTVGLRKALVCRESGFAARVVDPRAGRHDGIDWVAEEFRSDHLAGASVAVAAATPEVNAAVVAAARERGIPVSDAITPDAGDFDFPATVRHGDFTLAVSTGGASPTLAGRIRDRLASEFGPDYGDWVTVLTAVRRRVLETVADAVTRRELLAGFADPRWLERLREVGTDEVLTEMLARVEATPRGV